MSFSTARHALLLLLAVGANLQPALAQPPARPAVSVVSVPDVYHAAIPADVDGDRRPDLVGATKSKTLVVARGNGDGTFGQPRSLGRTTVPLTVADFNGDTFADIVTAEVAILPGRGDGTFGTARTIATDVQLDTEVIAPRVVARDLNGDGKRDLALIDSFVVVVYPGNGDLTFGPRFELPAAGDGARSLTSADVNGDSRIDLIASTISNTLEVFLNAGGFLFRVNSMPAPFSQWDIAAGDVNGDRRHDLVLASSSFGNEFSPGQLLVFLGNGDGTFDPVVTYETGVRGAVTVALGDFNADGRVDVATGNRSWRRIDNACAGIVLWDSVSIFPGTGTDALGSPATFRLGTGHSTDADYRNTQQALWTSDINGDLRSDVVSAPGAVLLNRPATTNRAPRVSAGPDQTKESGPEILFDALATDPDFDWLEFQWTNGNGESLGWAPYFCAHEEPDEYTVTVSDGRGGTAADSFVVHPPRPEGTYLALSPIANTVGTQSPYTVHWSATELTNASSLRLLSSSNDGQTFTALPGCTGLPVTATQCTWSSPGPVTNTARLQIEALSASGTRLYFDASERFSIVSGPSVSLPPAWNAADIGAVGARGNSTFDGTTFTIRGSGSDIWGTADEFHYAFTHAHGDFSITARVTSVQNVNPWTKAGVMIRDGLFNTAANARHASMLVTPTAVKGTAFQRRQTTGGTSVSTAGPAVTAPYWVRLTRTGDTITAYTRAESSVRWTEVGSQAFTNLPDTLQVGLAVSSHADGSLATAKFDGVEVRLNEVVQPGWSEEDVGAVGAEGRSEVAGNFARVTGSGADIWGTADEFHWAFRHAYGDFSVQALVASIENVHAWTKAGLMIRASSAPGAQHASLFATPSAAKGIAFQSRRVTNGTSIQLAQRPVAPSVWLRLTRRGSAIDAYYRATVNDPWRHLGSVVLEGLPATVEVGFAVSSHVDGTLATAEFQQFTVEPIRTWTTTRIGPGSSDSHVDGTFFSVKNAGADIWGTSDAFTYVWTKWTGNGALTARLNELDAVHEWTKAGVMFRESLAPGSKHATALISAARGMALQYRASTGGTSASAGTRAGAAPAWLQIIREGDTFTMYVSTNTAVWHQVGQVTIPMPPELYIGLAVTSHNVAADAWGEFDDVTLRIEPFNPAPVPSGP